MSVCDSLGKFFVYEVFDLGTFGLMGSGFVESDV